MPDTQLNAMKLLLKKLWRSYEKTLIEQSIVADRTVHKLKAKKGELVQALSSNPDLANDIREQIANIKDKIAEAEVIALNTKSYDRDFNQFTGFALDYGNNLLINWWSLDKAVMRRGKELIFPAGFLVSKDKKVYPQEISPIYRYKPDQLNRKMNDLLIVEAQRTDNLHFLVEEMVRWREVLQQDYQNYLSRKRSQRSFGPS